MVDARPGGSDFLPLVGRERESQTLQFTFQRALDRRGGLVLVSGEAGIGKTALVQAFTREAVGQDALILQGYCYDLSTTPPYGLWLELTDRYPEDRDLARVPDVLRRGTGVGNLPHQMALFEVARDFLFALAHQRPLVVVLEDVHWADQASLDLLRYLARHLDGQRILLITTYRDDEVTRKHPLFSLLPSLLRETQALRLDLAALDRDAIHALVTECWTLPAADQEQLVAYLLAHAEGNPLFTVELLRSLEQGSFVRKSSDGCRLADLRGVPVPSLVRQIIEARVAQLGEKARHFLEVAAVIGQEVPLDVWQTVANMANEDVLAVLDQATSMHLLEEVTEQGTVQFVHALTREALYTGIVLPRRRLWHRLVAESLATAANPVPDTVAHHLQQAGDPRAVEWLILAGEHAERHFAWKEAFSLYNRGLDALREHPGNERQVAGLLLKTARLLRYFDPERGNHYLEAARQAAVNCGDDEIAALALFNMGNNLCVLEDARRGLRLMRDAVEALAATLVDATPEDIARLIRWSGTALVAAQDHPLKRINGSLVLLLAAFGRYHEAISKSERYLEVDWRAATTEDQYSSVVNATKFNTDGYKGLGIALSALGRPEEAKLAFDLAQEIVQLKNYIPYRLLVASKELILLHFPYRTKNLRERTELVQLIQETIQPSSGMTDAGNSLWGYEYYLLQEGRWDELHLTIQGNDLPTNSYYRSICLGVRARLAWAEGHTDHAWKLIHRILPNGVDTEFDEQAHSIAIETQQLAAGMAREAGDYDLAREWMTTLDDWLEWNSAVLGRANGMLIWARIHFDEGDSEEAFSVARKALEQASDPEQPLALIGIHRFLGELAFDSGDLDSAETHLCISIELAEVCRIPFERALTLISLAELHIARDDRDGALNLLRKAQEICTELGARPTLDKAERLAASLGLTHGETPYGLTSREIDVLYLLVQGMTDREIAKRLFISHRTVMRHVSNILRKLDMDSRTAAAAHAVRDGLV